MTRIIKTRNKQRTQARILDAVGEIIEQSGMHALGINLLARTSGHNKVLIYRYFGDLDHLISQYIQTVLIKQLRGQVASLEAEVGAKDISFHITKLLGALAANQKLVSILQWEISQACTVRVAHAFVTEQFYRVLPGTATSMPKNALTLIMCSAFTYLILQTGNQVGPLCTDLSSPSELESLQHAVKKILKNGGR